MIKKELSVQKMLGFRVPMATRKLSTHIKTSLSKKKPNHFNFAIEYGHRVQNCLASLSAILHLLMKKRQRSRETACVFINAHSFAAKTFLKIQIH